MSTDKKGTKILARTFFTQLRAGGYTPNQILDIATGQRLTCCVARLLYEHHRALCRERR